MFFIIGASYFAFSIWDRMDPGGSANEAIKGMSAWHLFPCFVLSAVILLSVKRGIQQFLRFSMLLFYMQTSQLILIMFYNYLPA
jgi:cytochrome c oxidase subunit IV